MRPRDKLSAVTLCSLGSHLGWVLHRSLYFSSSQHDNSLVPSMLEERPFLSHVTTFELSHYMVTNLSFTISPKTDRAIIQARSSILAI